MAAVNVATERYHNVLKCLANTPPATVWKSSIFSWVIAVIANTCSSCKILFCTAEGLLFKLYVNLRIQSHLSDPISFTNVKMSGLIWYTDISKWNSELNSSFLWAAICYFLPCESTFKNLLMVLSLTSIPVVCLNWSFTSLRYIPGLPITIFSISSLPASESLNVQLLEGYIRLLEHVSRLFDPLTTDDA